jgi:hypothetical protein
MRIVYSPGADKLPPVGEGWVGSRILVFIQVPGSFPFDSADFGEATVRVGHDLDVREAEEEDFRSLRGDDPHR